MARTRPDHPPSDSGQPFTRGEPAESSFEQCQGAFGLGAHVDGEPGVGLASQGPAPDVIEHCPVSTDQALATTQGLMSSASASSRACAAGGGGLGVGVDEQVSHGPGPDLALRAEAVQPGQVAQPVRAAPGVQRVGEVLISL